MILTRLKDYKKMLVEATYEFYRYLLIVIGGGQGWCWSFTCKWKKGKKVTTYVTGH